MAQPLSIAVGVIKLHIQKDIPEKAQVYQDVYVTLESLIAEKEVLALIAECEMNTNPVSMDLLIDFKKYLEKRDARINGTDADYSSADKSLGTLICKQVGALLARNQFVKKSASDAEIMSFCQVADRLNLTEEEKISKLKRACGENLDALVKTSSDLLHLMITHIQKKDWIDIISCCSDDFLKGLFLGAGYVNSKDSISDAIADLATNMSLYSENKELNTARLFCLIELYQRDRKNESLKTGSQYKGFLGKASGIKADRRISQSLALKTYLASDETDLDKFMSSHPRDKHTLYSPGRLSRIAQVASSIKTVIPTDVYRRPADRALGM